MIGHFGIARGAGLYMLHLHSRSCFKAISFVGGDKKIALDNRMSIININDLRATRLPIMPVDGE